MGRVGKCIGCLWNWQDVHGGTDRICYNRESKHFHHVAPEKGCKGYTTKVKSDLKEDKTHNGTDHA